MVTTDIYPFSSPWLQGLVLKDKLNVFKNFKVTLKVICHVSLGLDCVFCPVLFEVAWEDSKGSYQTAEEVELLW